MTKVVDFFAIYLNIGAKLHSILAHFSSLQTLAHFMASISGTAQPNAYDLAMSTRFPILK
jgi:hypothetical protein